MKRFDKRKKLLAAAALVLAAVIALSVIKGGTGSAERDKLFPSAYALAAPTYPAMPQYPSDDPGNERAVSKWQAGLSMQNRDNGYAAGLEPVMHGLMQQMLRENDGENAVCSPLNIYMALAMLAECTDGNSRAQILSLLGDADLASLRARVDDLWNDTYREDGLMNRVLAGAVWLDKGFPFHQETLDTLAQHYYAASFQGDMGTEAYNQALRDWLNAQTGGMLQDQIGGLAFDEEAVLALITTVYFKGLWASGGFVNNATKTETFHGAKGDADCQMMHGSGEMYYYWGEHFTAVISSFQSGGMRFILPDEGYTPEDLLRDPEALAFMTTGALDQWQNRRHLKVNRSIPRFDVKNQATLEPAMQALGISDVFVGGIADFSPVSEHQLYLSAALHGVRVKIDEDGCEGAAYTMMTATPTAGAPQKVEEIDFIADRPFLFVVTTGSGLPLFSGIVNQP